MQGTIHLQLNRDRADENTVCCGCTRLQFATLQTPRGLSLIELLCLLLLLDTAR